MTVADLLVASLRRIGVAAQGVTPQAESLQQALLAFNAFVDGLGADRLTLYGETRTTWTITSGVRDYAVGAGHVINRVRPVFVEQLGGVSPIRYINTSQSTPQENPLTLLNDQQWRAIAQKTLQGVLPTCAYYQPTYPTGTISLWQVPTSSTLQGVLYAPTAMTEFALSDTLSLPPGYRRFLLTNTALELCPEFDRKVPEGLSEQARQSKADIERANLRLIDMAVDAMWTLNGAGVYNIYSDTSTR